MTREKAIKGERRYAEKRFRQLMDQVEQIDKELPRDYIEMKLRELDEQWRNFCDNLIYLDPHGKDEFMKIAELKAFPPIKVMIGND